MNQNIGFAAPLVAFVLLGIIGESFTYRRYVGLARWQSILLGALSAGLSVMFCVCYHDELSRRLQLQRDFDDEPFTLCASIILPLLAIPFVVRLYRKFIGGWLTDAEKLPGMDGIRAWLGVGNLLCATLIPVCVWLLFGVSLAALFALTFGLVLVYPVFNLVSAAPQPAPAAPAEDLSAERDKVLRLLEAGKITADESAELLNALGSTVPHRPPPDADMKMSPARKMVLLGAALLLVGFFLPWFSINTSQLFSEAAGQMRQMMGGMTPRIDLSPQFTPDLNSMSLQVHAGDVAHGLGWWILALGIGAAALPFFITNLKADLQKRVILAALAVGAFLLVYLAHNSLRFVSAGSILAAAGYALEFVGTMKERPVPR